MDSIPMNEKCSIDVISISTFRHFSLNVHIHIHISAKQSSSTRSTEIPGNGERAQNLFDAMYRKNDISFETFDAMPTLLLLPNYRYLVNHIFTAVVLRTGAGAFLPGFGGLHPESIVRSHQFCFVNGFVLCVCLFFAYYGTFFFTLVSVKCIYFSVYVIWWYMSFFIVQANSLTFSLRANCVCG